MVTKARTIDPKAFVARLHDALEKMQIDTSDVFCVHGLIDPKVARDRDGTWGKLKDAYKNNVVVYSCASITFPMIAQYALVRAKSRRQRRLFTRLSRMVETLRQAAAENPKLRAQPPEYFGDA